MLKYLNFHYLVLYCFAKTVELKCKFYVSILKSASQLSNFRHSHYYGHETKNWNGYSINDVMHICCAPFANIANEHIHTYYTVWKANFATKIRSFEGFLTTRSFRGVIVLTSSFVRFVTIFQLLFIPNILDSKICGMMSFRVFLHNFKSFCINSHHFASFHIISHPFTPFQFVWEDSILYHWYHSILVVKDLNYLSPFFL